jgi:hypothetical protein
VSSSSSSVLDPLPASSSLSGRYALEDVQVCRLLEIVVRGSLALRDLLVVEEDGTAVLLDSRHVVTGGAAGDEGVSDPCRKLVRESGTHPEWTDGPLWLMKALRRYLAGREADPPRLGVVDAAVEAPALAAAAGASSSPGSFELENSHSTAASGLPDCEMRRNPFSNEAEVMKRAERTDCHPQSFARLGRREAHVNQHGDLLGRGAARGGAYSGASLERRIDV